MFNNRKQYILLTLYTLVYFKQNIIMVRSWLLITPHSYIRYQWVNQLLPKALLPVFLLFVSDQRPGMNGMDAWYQVYRTEPNIMYKYLLHKDMHCLMYSLMYWTIYLFHIQWLNKGINIFGFILSLQPLVKSLSCTCLSAMSLVPQCFVITFSFGSYFKVCLLHKSMPEMLMSS